MTRTQVARRLGKSLATVRRIEGVLLHPTQDARGVHRFDSGEVEALARDIKTGRASLALEMRRNGSESPMGDPQDHDRCANCLDLEREIATLRDELEERRAAQRLELTRLQIEHDRQRAIQDAEASELATQVAELISSLED